MLGLDPQGYAMRVPATHGPSSRRHRASLCCSRSYKRALIATPFRPPQEASRLPACLYGRTCAREIGAPSCSPSCSPCPAAAPSRRVSCPSQHCAPAHLLGHSPSSLLLHSAHCPSSAPPAPNLPLVRPRPHKASRHATLQRLRYLLHHRRLGDGKHRSSWSHRSGWGHRPTRRRRRHRHRRQHVECSAIVPT